MPTTVTINNIIINGGTVRITGFDGGTLTIGGLQQTTTAQPRERRRARRQIGYEQDGSCPERAIQIIDTDEAPPVQRGQRAPPEEQFGQRGGLSTMSSASRTSRPRLTAATAPYSPQRAHSTATTVSDYTDQDPWPSSSVAQAGSSRDWYGHVTYGHGHGEETGTQATIRELDLDDETEMADDDYPSSQRDDDWMCDDMTCPCNTRAHDQNTFKREEGQSIRRPHNQ